ncbi:MAG: hypothetical protein SPI35_06635 [Porphyromonas sp.]|nr:hypothetical protein [Porphyromonas sp.]
MKQIQRISLLLLVGTLLIGSSTSCKKKENVKGKEIDNPQTNTTDILKELPSLPVAIGSTLFEVEKKESELKSIETKRTDAAGYIMLEYKTTDPKCPLRTHMIKKESDELKISALWTTYQKEVWKEPYILHQEVINLFVKAGYRHDLRVDQDGYKHHYFLKEVTSSDSSMPEYLECLVQKETKNGQEYTSFSFRITDVVAG